MGNDKPETCGPPYLATQGLTVGLSATGTAVVVGVGLAIWPTPVGEGSDIIPAMPSPVEMAKGGKQYVKDDGLIGIPTNELEDKYYDPNTSAKEKKRIEKELKCRGERNKRKRRDMKRCF